MYSNVTSTARIPNTTVFLTTTSRSYSRYLRIAMAEATGIPMSRAKRNRNNETTGRAWGAPVAPSTRPGTISTPAVSAT